MKSAKEKKKSKKTFGQVFYNENFQRVIIGVISLLAVFIMIAGGAEPKRYKLTMGAPSGFDINAPRDIENTMKTEELAMERVNEVPPVISELEAANTRMLSSVYDFFDTLDTLRTKLIPMLEADPELKLDGLLTAENQNTPIPILMDMTQELRAYLFRLETGTEISVLKQLLIRDIMPQLSAMAITQSNISQVLEGYHLRIENTIPSIQMQRAAMEILSGVVVPNSMVDETATAKQKNAFLEAYKLENPVMVYEGERFIRKEDIITPDLVDVARKLGILDEKTGPDYLFLASVFLLLVMLWFILAIFIRSFTPKVYQSRNELLFIASIIVLTVFLALMAREFIPEYAPYITIGFIAPVLLAIFINIQLSIIVNLILTISLSLLFPDNLTFVFMSVISGTFAAFLSANANQRRRISLTGLIIGSVNVFIVASTGVIEKNDWVTILERGGLSFLNGILSVIFAIGLLPIFESLFNMVTPLKLLELADPNHPLLKRLLMEAPGTYHHSLMVGNLAEVSVRSIGGNSLIARVGAYFHDVGKLKRPAFFKENQMSENPHDRITPNLSTLVITSHTKDGEELAIKYKLPKPIRDIIVQHHGNTLVAYFYHKARQGGKGTEAKENNFRYEGPKPQTREAAVVLLADSVEAAVRSMQEKTKGKIEGLIRKIIKDKLDDGQLDHCDLTLKDLTDIANGFLTVLSGFFHERTEYPELEKKNSLSELDNQVYTNSPAEKKETQNEDNHTKQAEEKIPSDETAEAAANDDSANIIED
ncbi:MAG: HDIG domain-containing protein [Thermoclostridium sp.]|nr:HDIG domain-containing protein [Thermoclostridium sp.]